MLSQGRLTEEEVSEVWNRQAQEFKKSCRTRMTMESVERFKNKERSIFRGHLIIEVGFTLYLHFSHLKTPTWGKSLIRLLMNPSWMRKQRDG